MAGMGEINVFKIVMQVSLELKFIEFLLFMCTGNVWTFWMEGQVDQQAQADSFTSVVSGILTSQSAYEIPHLFQSNNMSHNFSGYRLCRSIIYLGGLMEEIMSLQTPNWSNANLSVMSPCTDQNTAQGYYQLHGDTGTKGS